ncbi:nucleotidyltransferase domain-containing protein [Ignicoccus hospitalis]|uniref:protein adenylyltransferase n=1 Tax=Ignicoccus hospitalis (strain KIN4/I / DSM 18386 / JCM 14125) TaxID=453591 RepID=A8A9K4_IGNH4|nr:nucleotidyltransferase domain-containing protein [Ignicoccus hospitalis]ABU81606.1 DNA polymerase, beta domain protein region [Ignicoccus hospitalis KIN4/I]
MEYDGARWELLRRKREKAIRVMERLAPFSPVVHGSVARGDVNEDSDVDVAILFPVEPYKVEAALGFSKSHGYIIMATPRSTPKVYLALDEKEEVVVSFPLGKLTTKEREFYAFGGELDLKGLKEGKRVPGVNKDLLLIVPTPYGHEEEPVIGREEHVAKVLGISAETVKERVRLLTKRREKGRTGVFLEFKFWGPAEEAIHELAKTNKAFRRRVVEEGLL